MDKEFVSGMELAKDFYERYGKKMIKENFPEYEGRIAAGKCGAGSECFEMDDWKSRDHDFCPGFSLWLTAEDYGLIGADLQNKYMGIYEHYVKDGYRTSFPQLKPEQVASESIAAAASNRHGVRLISDFYQEHTGYPEGPRDTQWLIADEACLAAAVNGQVFKDDLGIFTSIRNYILKGAPEKLYLMKLAQCMTLYGQSAQYNLIRALKRKDYVTACIEKGKSMKMALELIYKANKTFAPHDKLLIKGIEKLSRLRDAGDIIKRLGELDIREEEETENLFERLSVMILNEYKSMGYLSGNSSFIPDYAEQFARKIREME